jgi:hypothetical protein
MKHGTIATEPPLEYAPVAAFVTVNCDAVAEATVALVRLYATGVTPVMVTTEPTDKVFAAV